MRPDLAETTATEALEVRVEALEHVLAVIWDMMGVAFKGMSNPGGFTTYGVRVVDSEGRTIATVGRGADGAGELVLHDPATGASVAMRP